MTEQPKQTQPTTPLMQTDPAQTRPTIPEYYKKFSWAIPILERLGGFKIPIEIKQGLEAFASGKPLTAEDMAKLQTGLQQMIFTAGEVMTRPLAQTAWHLHYKEGLGFQDIAEQFAKDGIPCTDATVARWINDIDEKKRFGKTALFIRIGKFLGYAGIVALAVLIIHWLW